MEPIAKGLGERPTMEHVLLVLFLGVGIYMYVGADEFSPDAATFPQLLAGVTVVLSALLLVRNYLPGPIRSFVAEPMQVLGEDDMETPEDTDGEDAEPAKSGDGAKAGASGGYTYDIDDPRGPAVTGALCVLYMGLTFVIGMLYATPIFVAAYALWARMELPRAGALTALSFLTAYAFYALISGDIAIGWYTGWRLPVP
ncbi:MAG: tripartite tricarboxylate transporter TctB family protein [Halalkalicoccus sp.]